MRTSRRTATNLLVFFPMLISDNCINMETTNKESQEVAGSEISPQSSFLRRFGTKVVVYSGAAAIVGMCGIPALFSWIGFGSIGVTTGSWAAWWQASHFVPGIFGILQSATTTGAASALFTKVGVGGAVMKAYYEAKMKSQNDQSTASNT